MKTIHRSAESTTWPVLVVAVVVVIIIIVELSDIIPHFC